jgi:Heparan-alpha-glucosaminide N-acetyltransferase, catalytic
VRSSMVRVWKKIQKKEGVNLTTAGIKSELDAGASSSSQAPIATTWRVNSVDLLRGVVMVLMLLDHTREFVHRDILNFDATDLTRTNLLLFFTRWITHFCAPVFVFLAGTSAFLQMARGKSRSELSKSLVKRGLWLILIEVAIIRPIVWFNLDFHFAFIRLSRIFITFGRVPFFFYIGQWLMVHILATFAGLLAGQPVAWLFVGLLARPSPNPGNLGFSLWVVYLLWFLGLLLLYPPCRWFAEVKRRRKDWWLSYL